MYKEKTPFYLILLSIAKASLNIFHFSAALRRSKTCPSLSAGSQRQMLTICLQTGVSKWAELGLRPGLLLVGRILAAKSLYTASPPPAKRVAELVSPVTPGSEDTDTAHTPEVITLYFRVCVCGAFSPI